MNRDWYGQRGWSYSEQGLVWAERVELFMNRDSYEQREWSYL